MKLFSALVCAGLLVSPLARAAEPTIAAAELPEPVKAAILKVEPQAEIIAAEKVTKSGETLYHVRFKTLSTVKESTVSPDGILKETKKVE